MSLRSIPATVLKLVNKYGTTATYISRSPGTYNPATSSVSISTVSTSIKCIIEDYSEALRSIANMGDQSNQGIRIGDKKISFAGTAVTAKVDDQITVNSVTYQVINVTSVFANDVIALYSLHCRQS